jgi:uncharacterized delta-60 repeat protein
MKPKTTTRITVVCFALGLLALLCSNTQTAHAQQVQVNAADPTAAAQGTINLNVKVTGKGFKNGANAKWFITGTTDPGGVVVNSTTFVSSGEVTANITVSDTAVITNFDIQVLNSDGRGGKGTELFKVVAKGNNDTCTNLAQSATTGITFVPASSLTQGSTVVDYANCLPASLFPGSLDSCYGSNGVATTSINPDANWGVEVQVQPDGKSVVAVTARNPSGTGISFYAARYDEAGNLDPSFGISGVVRVEFTSCDDSESITSLVLQSDGKILLGGSAYINTNIRGFAVARLNPDGSLDNTFGNGGRVFFAFSQSSTVLNDMALQSDGKIVLAGEAGADFCLARLTTTGNLDGTFGSGGKVIAQTAKSGSGAVRAVAIQTINNEERIVVAGSRPASGNTSRDFAVIRFTSAGVLDSSFGSGGKIFTNFYGYADSLSDMVVIGNNIIVGGKVSKSSAVAFQFGLAKYNLNGQLDTTFGAGGKVVSDIYGESNLLETIVMQSDGKIIAGGTVSYGSIPHDIALARYNPNGTSDSTFGLSGTGLVVVHYSVDNIFEGLALQTDGKILGVGGVSFTTSGHMENIALFRFLL